MTEPLWRENWNKISKMSHTSTESVARLEKISQRSLGKKKIICTRLLQSYFYIVKDYKQNKCPFQWGPVK